MNPDDASTRLFNQREAVKRQLVEQWRKWDNDGRSAPHPNVRNLLGEVVSHQKTDLAFFLEGVLPFDLDRRKKLGVAEPALDEWLHDFPDHAQLVKTILAPSTEDLQRIPAMESDDSIERLKNEIRGAGQTIGEFTDVEEIDQGGQATVCRASDKNGRVVALKLIRFDKKDASVPEKIIRLIQEVKKQINLKHPHIVEVFGRELPAIDGVQNEVELLNQCEKDPPRIVMEWMDGGALKHQIAEGKLKGDHPRIAEIILATGSALAYAHRRKVIHRDVKPGNILFDENGKPKLSDFGLALSSHVGGDGTIAGTPKYMSPEQLRGDKVDPRSDIWSLGVVLYELLTGELPFDSTDDAKSKAPKPIQVSTVPEILREICLQCLEKDPNRRPQRADEIAVELGKFLRSGDPSHAENDAAPDQQPFANLNVFVSRTGEMSEYPKTGKTFVQAALDAIRDVGFVGKDMYTLRASGSAPSRVCEDAVRECGVYVGLLGMQWGTQVRDREEAISYTQLEFEAANRPDCERLVFVLDEDAELPGKVFIDRQNGDKQEKFRNDVQNQSGVTCKFFNNADQLEKRIADALREIKQKRAAKKPHPAAKRNRPAAQATFPAGYRQWLLEEYQKKKNLPGLDAKKATSILLTDVYVPLTTRAQREDKPHVSDDAAKDSFLRESEADQHKLLLSALDEGSLNLSGNAGTGKSTFCQWVTYLLALGRERFSKLSDVQDDKLRETFPVFLKHHLPILIVLREFWECGLIRPGRHRLDAEGLEQAIGDWVEAQNCPQIDRWLLRAHLNNGTLLLIFDGVDEVPRVHGDGEKACSPRDMLITGITAFGRKWTKRGNRMVVAGRPYGLEDHEREKVGLPAAQIGELPEPLQKLLVHRWFAILKGPQQGAETAQGMLEELAAQDDPGPIMRNPLLLTATCIIYAEDKRLPEDKYDLYHRIVDSILHNRFDASVVDRVAKELGAVAYEMHTGEHIDPPDNRREIPQATISVNQLGQILAMFRRLSELHYQEFDTILKSRQMLLNESGLLLESKRNEAEFYHFTFQDFFAAERLNDITGIDQERLVKVFLGRAIENEWHHTLSLLFGALLHNRAPFATWLLKRLIEKNAAEVPSKLTKVIADCLEMNSRKRQLLPVESIKMFQKICLDAIETVADARDRSVIVRALGLMTAKDEATGNSVDFPDPRIVADLRDHNAVDKLGRTAFIRIPAGPYVLNKEDASPWRMDKPFLLTRYPVSNSQFKLFYENGGYEKKDLWSPEGWNWRVEHKVKEPALWGDSRFNAPNQPVVGVSFWEAQAFAKWAGGRLPRENEWQAAAGGPNGLLYPWNGAWEDGICNSEVAGLGCTSPVGGFPRSRSADFELEDMAGNVWEWCDDLSKEGATARVIRGGSWGDPAERCRVSNRFRFLPGSRSSSLGFRLAASSVVLSQASQVAEAGTEADRA